MEKISKCFIFSLKSRLCRRETGCVIQRLLPWLLAIPNGLVGDMVDDKSGLVEIKCPKTKCQHGVNDLLANKSFYIGKDEEDNLYLKKDHSYGYYTQVQMTLGLSGLNYSDVFIYTFKCMIIVRVPFDNNIFVSLVHKLNIFYRDYLLPNIIKNSL